MHPMDKMLWWANSYKIAELLFAFEDLRLWGPLSDGPSTPESLARSEGLSLSRLKSSFDLLYRLGLLERGKDGYSAPVSMSAVLRLEAYLQRSLLNAGKISDWLKGEPVADPLDGNPPERLVRLFSDVFESFGNNAALHIWRFAGLRSSRNMLDLGGGTGALSSVLCALSESLRVTVADRSAMKPLFEGNTKELSFRERMSFEEVDLLDPGSYEKLIRGHDSVLLSNVLHLLPPEARDNLCETLSNGLAPGAKLIVHDLFLDSSEDGLATLMSLDWMLFGADFSMTLQECAELLEKFCFCTSTARKMPGFPTGIIVAENIRKGLSPQERRA